MDKRDVTELGELLERIDSMIHEYLEAATRERMEMLQVEITAAKEKLQRLSTRFKN
jgi:hypothetical protein